MKRGGRLKPQSARRQAEAETRRQVVAIVEKRAGGGCWYAPIIPEIGCEHIDRTRPMYECDELRGGSYRSTEYLDPDRCRLGCQAHHRWKTEHKLLFLDRLARYEETHPWPTTPTLADPMTLFGQ